jgi:hypothetical protein
MSIELRPQFSAGSSAAQPPNQVPSLYKLQPCQACGDALPSRKFAIQVRLGGGICSSFAGDLDGFPSLVHPFAAADDSDLWATDF